MISIWRRGFGSDSSWDIHDVPSGDYRIILRGIGDPWPERSSYEDDFWMTCRLGEIVFIATPYTLFALDPRVVQELLDIHQAVYPAARHPHAEELLRQRRHGEYLRALGRDLEDAVKHRLLRVEKLERPWPFLDVEEKIPSKPDSPPQEETDLPNVDILLDVPRTNADLGDTYLLESADGSFSKSLGRGAAVRKDDGTLLVRFKNVLPGKAYHLFQLAGSLRVPIFLNVPFGALDNHGTDAAAPKPRLEPEARTTEPVHQAENALVALNDIDRNEDPSFIESNPETALA
ncbi:hypothetical protein LVJ94_45545 [Pendulispora rubella]|uniref:Uncharacterized protein n=1 Tax=Pendulispora rubella TaxID=2741070 RepID=A0ABZ2KZP5_9BACT